MKLIRFVLFIDKKQGADAVPVSVSNRWADSVEEEEREGIREPEKVDGEVEKVAEGIQQLETDEKKEQGNFSEN